MQYIEGVLQIANTFLSLVAGIIAISTFGQLSKKNLQPWKYLLVVLIIFAAVLIVGALRSFGIYESPFLTHIMVTALLGVLIVALTKQIGVSN